MRTLLCTLALGLLCSVAGAAKRTAEDRYAGASMRLRQEIAPGARPRFQQQLLHAAGQLAPTLSPLGARATLRTVRELAPGHSNLPRVAHLLERAAAK